jgi:ferric-dicitrate binding protein FerR (iron transport regulator)
MKPYSVNDPRRDELAPYVVPAPEPYDAPRRGPWHAELLVAIVVAVLALVAIRIGPWTGEPLSFRVGNGTPGIENAWIRADSNADQPVVFSDGTTMLLRPGALARVTRLGPDGADVQLERGRAAVSLHPERTKWTFDFGPYEIQAAGARFNVGWDPTTSQLLLDMRDGSARMTGPGLGASRTVIAGEHLRLPLPHGTRR